MTIAHDVLDALLSAPAWLWLRFRELRPKWGAILTGAIAMPIRLMLAAAILSAVAVGYAILPFLLIADGLTRRRM